MNYTTDDLLKTAKRLNNTKRSYLLVNPLQAKHIPVSPKKSLEMMRTFGKTLFQKHPAARLIIGFAETATAIGAAAAECFPNDCVYIHTTRENFAGEFVYFREEHSHAVEQKLYAKSLDIAISQTPEIIFTDDEISTGKTLINIVECLKKEFPSAREKEFVAASLINRVSEENENRLLSAGIKSECLLKLPFGDYDAAVADTEVTKAKDAPFANANYSVLKFDIPNARKGVKAGEYKRAVREIAQSAAGQLCLPSGADVLVLGTEECMYPALVLGEVLEEGGARVLCHSTTRSPIGINAEKDYPIKSGYKLKSLYDSSRETFIYNVSRHSCAVVVSDGGGLLGANELAAILSENGTEKIYFVGAF